MLRLVTFAAATLMATAALQSPATAHVVEIRRGDSGPHVALWQKMLNLQLGGSTGKHPVHLVEDGLFGPVTAAATRWFERTSDLPSDGRVQARDRRMWIGSFITCCGAVKPTIYPGSYGPLVGHAQLELNEWLRTQTIRSPPGNDRSVLRA
ncbi:MAG TPA: peptidoglycan-binding domain-containing protein [Actinomycetota bacterium]|nr:peptidoglycan-binding domain-containing protein [Actinomycetota bacterium]